MAYGVLEVLKAAHQNIDSYVRPVVSATALENGFLVNLLTKSATAGESEAWTATVPVTGALTDLWMIVEPEVVLTESKYKNIDPNPENFIIPIGEMATAVKLAVGDLYKVTADVLSAAISTHTFFNATNNTWQMVPGATQTASVVSFKLRATSYINIPSGAIGSQRTTAYEIECIALG